MYTKNQISLSSSFRFAWDTFRARPVLYVGAILITEALWYIVRTAQIAFHTGSVGFMPSFLSFLVFGIVANFVFIALTNFFLRAYARPSEIQILDLLDFTHWKMLTFLFIVGGAVFLLGLLLLILPGLVFLTLFIFTPYVVADTGMTPFKGMRRALELSLYNVHKLAVVVLVTLSGSIAYFLLLSYVGTSEVLANTISIIIGVITIPLAALAGVHAYKTLLK